MNLQEQISRIQEMMELINENKLNSFIFKHFDKVFNNLRLVKTEDDYYHYDWINESGEIIFERNHWGTFWIYGCDEYSYLGLAPRMLRLTYDEFEEVLIEYLNKKYLLEFGEEKPLKGLGNENCSDYGEIDN